jgi:hypothetical protein
LKPAYITQGVDPIRAAIASLFEVPVAAVPDFSKDSHLGPVCGIPKWECHLAEWLEEQGLHLCVVTMESPATRWPGAFVMFDHVRIAKTQDGYQAAVFCGDDLIHDPGNAQPFAHNSYPQYLIFTER